MNSRITAAKVDAVLDPNLCFFGALLCNLKFREDATCDTAWTDGTSLGFNPKFVDSLPHAQVIGLLAHEVMHCAAAHPYRRDGRDPKKWNYACDYAINDILTDCGISLPDGSLKLPDPSWKGKSAEWIYDRLPDSPPQNGQGKGKGQGQPQPGNGQPQPGKGQGQPSYDDMAPGEVRDSPDPATEPDKKSEGEWKELARSAATQAKSRGNLPASLDRFSKVVSQAKVDWKEVLRRFVSQSAKADYTWRRPNPRYIGGGMYLPSLHSEAMPRIAIGNDTSGSIDEVALSQAHSEVVSVMEECRPEAIDVFHCDARVAHHETFERGDEIVWSPAGGGGTDFRPVFEAIEAMDEKPCCIVYITDLCGTFPAEAPEIPVLWITDGDLIAPFGETIKM